MALKVELKPGERILVGASVITNGRHRARFLIEGKAPVLREKDIITAEQATTPAKRIYFAVLLMYTAENPAAHHATYFSLVGDFLQAAPSAREQIEVINNQILRGEVYKALKSAKELITYEQDLIGNEERRKSLRSSRKQDVPSA
ncbi:MAG TPA: flagellar biosynthesis repressor FlbT [Pseudolabrys sp.]|nr:flagellar biosynthesis repressor FlbT [Pseudolabrys sp.]